MTSGVTQLATSDFVTTLKEILVGSGIRQPFITVNKNYYEML